MAGVSKRKCFPQIPQIIADITQINNCDDLRILREILLEFSRISVMTLDGLKQLHFIASE